MSRLKTVAVEVVAPVLAFLGLYIAGTLALAGLLLVVEPPHHPHHCLRGVLGRKAERLLAEVDLLLADVATQEQLVAGGRLAMGSPLGAEEPDVRGVVLAAAVGAAGDVDAQPADLGQSLLLEAGADGGAEAAALGDGQVAGVRARAARVLRRG